MLVSLRGVKPVNDVTVKTVLKSFLVRVRKEGRWTGRAPPPAPATRPQRAPVEDVTTQVHVTSVVDPDPQGYASCCAGSGSGTASICRCKPKCTEYEPLLALFQGFEPFFKARIRIRIRIHINKKNQNPDPH